jgi:hypothetical protein
MSIKEESFISRNGLWIGLGALTCAVGGYLVYRLAQEEDPVAKEFKGILASEDAKVPVKKENVKGKEIDVIEFEFYKKLHHKI